MFMFSGTIFTTMSKFLISVNKDMVLPIPKSNKQDLRNIKSKEARDAVKDKNKFKEKARVEKNHSILNMWYKK